MTRPVKAVVLLSVAAASCRAAGLTREQFIERATAAFDEYMALDAPAKA